jgi:replicative DNA helicase
VRRFHQARNYVPAEDLRGPPARAAQAMNAAALRALDDQDRLFIDDTHGMTIAEISARMRRLSREKGVRVFVADHLGEMRVERDDRWGDRHDLALGKAARAFRDTAKELGAAPVLVSQMNRQIERRNDGQPRMADLDGSGQVEQAARVIAFLSQPEDASGKFFQVDLVKNTNGRTGPIRLRWVPERMAVE